MQRRNTISENGAFVKCPDCGNEYDRDLWDSCPVCDENLHTQKNPSTNDDLDKSEGADAERKRKEDEAFFEEEDNYPW